MTAAEIRGVTTSYFRLRSLLNQPLTEDAKTRLADFLRWVELDCFAITDTSPPARWARSMVGSVLAAAIGAGTCMRDEVATPTGALRIFGLTGGHALPPAHAWKLVQPYVWEPTINEQMLETIARESGLRLKLPKDPGPVDVLEELTRPRNSGFCVQVGYWLVQYFQEHPSDGTPYAGLYRSSLAGLTALNVDGAIPHSITTHARMAREDWEELLRGRSPQAWLESKAGYVAARQFVTDYWEKWQPKKDSGEGKFK